MVEVGTIAPRFSLFDEREREVKLPTTGEVSWLLADGPFTYFRGRVSGWSADSDAESAGVGR